MPCISKPELVRLQKTLKTDAAIGAKFNISRQAVHQFRILYGIRAIKDKNKERNAKIIRLRKQGVPYTKISKDFGLAVSHLFRIVARGK